MNTPVQTYPVSFPPSVALLRMAGELATARKGEGAISGDGAFAPASRPFSEAEPEAVPASLEYYRIIDRISAGERP